MKTSQRTVLVAYRAFSDVVGKGAFLLVTILAARRLTGEAFGAFSLASTLGWIAAVGTDFGIQLHLARAVARHPEKAEVLLRAWLRARLGTAVFAAASIATFLSATRLAGAYTSGLILVAIVYLVNGLIEFFHYFYRGLSRSDIESTLTLWQRGATLAFAAVALWWRPSLDTLAIALGLPAAATLAYSARRALLLGRAAAARDDVVPPAAPSSSVISGRSSVSGRRVSAPASDARPEAADDWQLASVWPIGAGIVLSALYFRVDVFLVEWWSGTKAVGLYNSAFRLVEALRLFPAAAVAVALPSLCRTRDYRPLLQLSTSVTVFASVGTAVLWVSASWLIPALYGSAYVAAIPAFRILLLAFPLMSLNYALTHQLIGWNGHRFYAGLCATALVVNLASNARLIPALSIVGAAWSTLLTEVVITAGCAAALWTGSRTRTPQLAVSGGS